LSVYHRDTASQLGEQLMDGHVQATGSLLQVVLGPAVQFYEVERHAPAPQSTRKMT
jgi:hypothetical protein